LLWRAARIVRLEEKPFLCVEKHIEVAVINLSPVLAAPLLSGAARYWLLLVCGVLLCS
jgi:hypothetical protein